MLADARVVTIGSSAVLDLAGNTETIGGLTLTGGSVATGAGNLILGGDVTINSVTFPTVLSGNLSTGGAARTMSVSDGTASEDVIINARASGAAALIITGAGTIRLNADNSGLTGGIRTIGSTGQVIVLGHPQALGGGLADLSNTTLRAAVSLTGADKVMTPVRSSATGVTIDMANLELGGAMTFAPAGILRLTVNGPSVFSGFLDATTVDATTHKTGTGTLTMNGTGNGVGKFQIDAGTVEVASQFALGSQLVSLRPATGQTATLAVTAPIGELGALDNVGAAGTSLVLIGNGPGGSDSDLRLIGPQNAIFSGSIRDADGRHGQFRKTGLGTQTLTGVNTYTGATNVGGGTLIVNNTVTGTSSVTVSGGGALLLNSTLTTSGGVAVSGDNSLLGGSGQITLGLDGAVVTGPSTRLSPGNAAGATGVFTISGFQLAAPRSTFLSDRSVWTFEMNPAVPGGSADPANLSAFDRISVFGNVVLLEPTLTLTTTRFESQINDLFFILINDGVDPISGTFAGLPQGAAVQTSNPMVTFAMSYVGDSATNSPTGGNDVTLRVTRAPEPGAWVFTVFGCILLTALRQRRTQSEK